VPNHWPEKSGFGSRKTANPGSEIHVSRFGYHPYIHNGFQENFDRNLLTFRGGPSAQKIKISQKFSGFE
jgi:hypothetical protein